MRNIVQCTGEYTVPSRLTIEDLIERVDGFQRREYMDTIEHLDSENALLQRLILKYQMEWRLTVDTFERMQQVILSLQKATKNYIMEDMRAAKDCLAFWGIHDDETVCQNYHPAGWI
jgi:hypothetical protein